MSVFVFYFYMGALSGWPSPMQMRELMIDGIVDTGFTHLYMIKKSM